MRNQEFWFTDYRYLNDPNELAHGMKIAKSMLQERVGSDGIVKFLYGWIADILTQKNFDKVFRFYIASFSRKRDELGQWRAYADDGCGVAIGMSPILFEANEPGSSDSSKNSFVGPIFYDDAQTKRRHAKGLDQAAKTVEDALRYANRHLRDKSIGKEFLGRLARAVVAAPLLWNALTCKHVGYAHEQEVRLIVIGEKKRFHGGIRKRLRNGVAVPYITRQLPLRTKGNITEILIGPAAPSTAESEIRTLLESLGMNWRIPIRRSKIPYRSISR